MGKTNTTTTSIRTPTSSSQDSELSELPRSAPSQSEADAEPGSAPTLGYSLTLFFYKLFLYFCTNRFIGMKISRYKLNNKGIIAILVFWVKTKTPNLDLHQPLVFH